MGASLTSTSDERKPLLDGSKLELEKSEPLVRKHSRGRFDNFGELDHRASDGSFDALGAGAQLQDIAAAMLAPHDQIHYVRANDPPHLERVISDLHAESKLSGETNWSNLSAEEAASRFSVSLKDGLASAEAALRLQNEGPNELEKGQRPAFIPVLLNQMMDVTLWVMAVAGLVYVYGMGEVSQGFVMLVGVCVIWLANAIGEYSTAEGASALSDLAASEATVLRDGNECKIRPQELVRGDIVRVRLGETVPADMRIVSITDLHIDEGVLTGESHEVAKTEEPLQTEEPFPKNMMYSSTAVVGGKATGLVTATGMNAQVGQIAQRLDVSNAGRTSLQKTMSKIGGMAGVVVLVLIFAITIVCLVVQYQDPSHPCLVGDVQCFVFSALSRGLIIGLACVPATMPLMTTLLLMTARHTIAKKGAIVRRMSSVETLGSCTVICSDKTGTLTEGKMVVVEAVTIRQDGMHRFTFYPTDGFEPYGGIFKESKLDAAQQAAIVKSVKQGSMEFPLYNYGDAQHALTDIDSAHVRTLMVAASLNSYGTELLHKDGKWIAVGNMSERALVVAAAKAGVGPPGDTGLALEDPSVLHPPEGDIEVPFSASRKMMCTVHIVSKNAFVALACSTEISHVAVVKGAPDRLLPLADHAVRSKPDAALVVEQTLAPEVREALERENRVMASKALRVLLVCVRLLTAVDVKQLRTLDADSRMQLLTRQMAVLGAFGIEDPPRRTVPSAVLTCKDAGMRVIMITGDQPATALAIGIALGIVKDESETRLCSELHDGDILRAPEHIDSLVQKTNAWARAQPSDKVAIVESLKRLNHTVAMTGDGVNDAPALKKANIGTAMGISGTEVAKGVADLVLMDDDFTTIVSAIEEGRRAYSNIQTYIGFYLAIAVAEVLTYALALGMLMPMPVEGLQLMVLAGLAHIAPPFMLYKTPAPADAMNVPPRRKDGKLLTRPTVKWLIIPWVFGWCALWTCLSALAFQMFTGFSHTDNIIGSSQFLTVRDRLATCEFAGVMDASGGFVQDQFPFHCSCSVRNSPFEAPQIHSRWGGSASRSEVMQELSSCWADDALRWCWKGLSSKGASRFQIDTDEQCSVTGSMSARTMCFLGCIFAELLFVLSMSSHECIVFTMFRNMLLLCVVVLCACCALLVIYVPIAAEILELRPLTWGPLLTALAFSFLSLCYVELLKVGYRWEKRGLDDLRYYHARAAARGLVSAWATDDEVEAYRAEHPHEDPEA